MDKMVNIKTIVNSKTDLESRLQTAIFIIEQLNHNLKESKKEIDSLKEVMSSASDILLDYDDAYQCCLCDKWYDIHSGDFYFCENDECSFKSCNKYFHGVTCESEKIYCLDCIEEYGNMSQCNLCNKWCDTNKSKFYFCCNDECLYKSCDKCFNGIICEGTDVYCLDCVEECAHKCDNCGKWYDNYNYGFNFYKNDRSSFKYCDTCFNDIKCENGHVSHIDPIKNRYEIDIKD